MTLGHSTFTGGSGNGEAGRGPAWRGQVLLTSANTQRCRDTARLLRGLVGLQGAPHP